MIAKKTAKCWFGRRIGRAQNVRTADRLNWLKNCRYLPLLVPRVVPVPMKRRSVLTARPDVALVAGVAPILIRC